MDVFLHLVLVQKAATPKIQIQLGWFCSSVSWKCLLSGWNKVHSTAGDKPRGQTPSATAPKKSQDFYSVQKWLVKPVPPSVCCWHKGSPHSPNQLNLKLECGYSMIWVAGGQGAGSDSKTAVLSGGGEAEIAR